jgi:hypothetical protein
LQALPAVGRIAGKVLGPESMLASPEAMSAGEAITTSLGFPSFQQRMADRSGASQLPERADRSNLPEAVNSQSSGGDFDSQMAELEALLSQMGGQAEQAPSPVQNAIASQYAAMPSPNPAFPPNRLLATR